MTNRKRFFLMVDHAVEARLGCSMHDLPDFTYNDYYDDEIQSVGEMKNAVEMCVEDLVCENMNDAYPSVQGHDY